MGHSAHDSRAPQENVEFSPTQILASRGQHRRGALALPLLAACAPALPAAAPTRPATTVATNASAVYPSYVPFASGPRADFPANGPMYDDAFGTYPANPVKALSGDPPSQGGPVNITSIQ